MPQPSLVPKTITAVIEGLAMTLATPDQQNWVQSEMDTRSTTGPKVMINDANIKDENHIILKFPDSEPDRCGSIWLG